MSHRRNVTWQQSARRLMAVWFMSLVLLLPLAACADETGTTGSTTATTATPTTGSTTTATTTAPTTSTSATTTATGSTTTMPTATGSTTTSASQPSRPAETTVILKLEGKDEPVRATLFTSPLGYTMYYDKALHTVRTGGSTFEPTASSLVADRYEPIRSLEGIEVYLEIGRLRNRAPQAALAQIRTILESSYKSVRTGDSVGIGVSKITAQVLEASDGDADNSRLATVAVISDGQQGSYYFLNAYAIIVAQGHKARLNQMIDTFRIE